MAKKCTKKRDARAKLLFWKWKPIAFSPFSLPSSSSLLKLFIVVIQKFGYHGNVSSLLRMKSQGSGVENIQSGFLCHVVGYVTETHCGKTPQ